MKHLADALSDIPSPAFGEAKVYTDTEKGRGMGEHSLEELKRQFEQAASKFEAAKTAKAYAERKLHERMCRDSGYFGKRATNPSGVSMVVHDIGFMSGRPWFVRGFRIKKDGSVGNQETTFYNIGALSFHAHPTPSDTQEQG